MTSIFFLLSIFTTTTFKEITDVSRFYLCFTGGCSWLPTFMNKIFFEAGILTVQKHKCPQDFLIFWLHIELFNQLLVLFKCSFWFAAKLNPREKCKYLFPLNLVRVLLTIPGRFPVIYVSIWGEKSIPASVVWKRTLSMVFFFSLNTHCFHRGNGPSYRSKSSIWWRHNHKYSF